VAPRAMAQLSIKWLQMRPKLVFNSGYKEQCTLNVFILNVNMTSGHSNSTDATIEVWYDKKNGQKGMQ
jgi:hypothetical protein